MAHNKFFFFLIFSTLFSIHSFAQIDIPLYTSYTAKDARVKMHDRILQNTIIKGLSLPLNDDTEDKWMDAFNAMEVFDYHNAFTQEKIKIAFDSLSVRSADFQRALLELVYSNNKGQFLDETKTLLNQTNNPKVFAMCAEYLMVWEKDFQLKKDITVQMFHQFGDTALVIPVLSVLSNRLQNTLNYQPDFIKIAIKELTSKSFLPGITVMYSFQRKNRDYPGLVLIRDRDGKWVTDSSGEIFNIPQLARSVSNLPGYLTNGNTPQGIYRMYGFGVSMSHFIGPTPNIQMGMPFEIKMSKFFDDSALTDTIWDIKKYRKLIPEKLQNFSPLYESYEAGMTGRREIIAHGTTLDPQLYSTKPYYPLTPTLGCLCTKEIWSGKRLESDQQKLVNGLLKAGGAKGYVVVLEIDDKNEPVTMEDLQEYLKL